MSFNILPLAIEYVTTEQFYRMVIILVVGIAAALIYTAYNTLIFGKFINAMRLASAVGEENAKSLETLGFGDNKIIKNSLRRNTTLAHKVKKNEKGYYLSSEDLEELSKRYNLSSFNARDLLLTIVILITIFLILWLVIPALTEFINTTVLKAK